MKTDFPKFTLSTQSMEMDIPMDDEGPPVFDMSDSNCSLPDVVLQASPTAGRRRSASINIPPQEVIRSIGSSLRRLSEEFELTLMQRARRRTSENSLQLNGNS